MTEIKDIIPATPFSGARTIKCPHCGADILTNAGKWFVDECPELDEIPEECGCPDAVAERARIAAEAEKNEKARQAAIWRGVFAGRCEDANIPEAWYNRGLAVWKKDSVVRENAWNAAKNAGSIVCGTIPPDDMKRGLCIAGDVGTGKTFLASCFAVSLIRRDVRVRWANVGDFLREIRSSFATNRPETEIVRKYTAPDVLIFDDLGKERPTDWACEQLFSVVNSRYDAEKALVVTTNYSLKELVERLTPRPDSSGRSDDTTARAIVDRLRAMCALVVLDGRSQR